MIKFPTEPSGGGGINASWGRDVVRSLRALRIVAGRGINVTEGPGGQRVSRKSDLTTTAARASASGPWAVSFAGDAGAVTATFHNCYFKRDSFTLNGGDSNGEIEFAMPSSPATLFVGFQFNAESGDVTIITGSGLSAVSESSVPGTNVELVKTPLYIMELNGSSWSVKADLIGLPSVGLAN